VIVPITDDDLIRHRKTVEHDESLDMYNSDDEDGTSNIKRKDQNRDHKCGFCAKTYLSYPALYTHLKNKHAKGPDGNPIAQLNIGRGRGRPKKLIGGVPATRAGLYRSHLEPNCPNFFKSIEKQGGPIFPDIAFEEIYYELYVNVK